jgi:hypothetical protein
MSTTRQVSWGDALTIEVFHTNGGLKAITKAITVEMGPTIGSRNTFAKLLHIQSPEVLNGRDSWRAWVLLAAVGQEPSDWGLNDDNAPASVDTEALKVRLRALVRREGIEPPTRWFRDNVLTRILTASA